MVFLRRSRNENPRPELVPWRVGLFFLAAGVWLAGVLADDLRITGAAIGILALAIVLRFFPTRAEEEQETDPPD
jgi:hypothetical protein